MPYTRAHLHIYTRTARSSGPFLFTAAIVKAEEGRLIPRAGRYTFESSWCLTAGEIPGHRIQVRERTLVARGTGRGKAPPGASALRVRYRSHTAETSPLVAVPSAAESRSDGLASRSYSRATGMSRRGRCPSRRNRSESRPLEKDHVRQDNGPHGPQGRAGLVFRVHDDELSFSRGN